MAYMYETIIKKLRDSKQKPRKELERMAADALEQLLEDFHKLNAKELAKTVDDDVAIGAGMARMRTKNDYERIAPEKVLRQSTLEERVVTLERLVGRLFFHVVPD